MRVVEASTAADSVAASAWLDSVQRLAIPSQAPECGQSIRTKHILEMVSLLAMSKI